MNAGQAMEHDMSAGQKLTVRECPKMSIAPTGLVDLFREDRAHPEPSPKRGLLTLELTPVAPTPTTRQLQRTSKVASTRVPVSATRQLSSFNDFDPGCSSPGLPPKQCFPRVLRRWYRNNR